MTTKTARGRIRTPGVVGLTFEAQTALEEGDPVSITGPYEVSKADGTKRVIGICAVPNKGRVGGNFPVGITPGQCTIDAKGHGVATLKAGGSITAGDPVGVSVTGTYVVVADTHISRVGTALTSAALNALFDLLYN